MRVLLGVPWYFPESIGGTEIYVRGLARELKRADVEVAVAAPTERSQGSTYVHEGVPVFRYPSPEGKFGELSTNRAEPAGWADVLRSFAPEIVDLHSLTSSLELAHLKAARRHGARTLVTLHIPDVICARGTFMRFGETPCSGDLEREPCTACRLESRGVPRVIGRMVSHIPTALARTLASSPLPNALTRAVSVATRDDDRRSWLHAIVEHADRLVTPSAWLEDVLLRNGVPRHRIVVCRQGVDVTSSRQSPRQPTGMLKVGYVGRYDAVKGLHVLIDAAGYLPPAAAIEVHVWGVARSPSDQVYKNEMIRRANGSPRIIFHEETKDTSAIYSSIHVLAVPSLWLETGPLVVLEAQAAGIPVVGSNAGGIAERISNGVDGVLIPPGDARALAEALRTLAGNPQQLEALRPRRLPRTVADVGRETLVTYRALVSACAA